MRKISLLPITSDLERNGSILGLGLYYFNINLLFVMFKKRIYLQRELLEQIKP